MFTLPVPSELRIVEAPRLPVEDRDEKAFTSKLADTVAQAWTFLPYRRVTRLHFRLFRNGHDFIASVASEDALSATYWTGAVQDRYLHLVPAGRLRMEKEALVYEGRSFALFDSWETGSPAID